MPASLITHSVEALRVYTIGLVMVEIKCIHPAIDRAIFSAQLNARRLGTSSPNTMETKVKNTTTMMNARGRAALQEWHLASAVPNASVIRRR